MYNFYFKRFFYVLGIVFLNPITISAQSTLKPLIESNKGMVVSTHPMASEIGLEILKRGGNAVDAAVAVNFALAVCHPAAGNIGGGGFLVYRNKKGKVAALDFREKAPLLSSKDMYLDEMGNIIPDKSQTGIFSVGVPGAVDGMVKMHNKFGKMSWESLLQPAIDLAAKGVVLTEKEARGLNRQRTDFLSQNVGKNYMLKETGWNLGDTLFQFDLANALRRIALFKRKGFYKGETAQFIIAEMKAKNGLISQKDLNKYHSKWRKPIKSTYKDYTIIGMPPPSSGGIALGQLLKMVEPFPLSKWGPTADSTVQTMIEAERRVYADRSKWLGDPDFVKVPVKELLDNAYLHDRMKDFTFEKATPSSFVKAGEFSAYESPETTHYSIVDADGNAVSITTTLNNSYGSKVFVGGAGFLLNDEMDDFSAKPGYPNLYGLIGSKANEIKAQKRMLSSMTPTIIEQNKQLRMVVGTPGGSTIITSVFQVVLNVLEFGMNMQQAVEYPRFHHQWQPEKSNYETRRFPSDQLSRLEQKGYLFNPVNAIGLVEGILILPNYVLQGGADSRGDDTVKAY